MSSSLGWRRWRKKGRRRESTFLDYHLNDQRVAEWLRTRVRERLKQIDTKKQKEESRQRRSTGRNQAID